MFCSNEKEIAHQSSKIIAKYYGDMSNREQIKKMHETFHFLAFLGNRKIKYEHIEPHEPGDFILFDYQGKKHLYEVVTIFGTQENIFIENNLNNVFKGFTTKYMENINFDYNILPNQFLKCLFKKNNKDYFFDLQFDSVNLLIVTSEYDRSSICGPWLLREMQIELTKFMVGKKFDKIYFIDYAASGVDNGPISGDLEEELEILNKYIAI